MKPSVHVLCGHRLEQYCEKRYQEVCDIGTHMCRSQQPWKNPIASSRCTIVFSIFHQRTKSNKRKERDREKTEATQTRSTCMSANAPTPNTLLPFSLIKRRELCIKARFVRKLPADGGRVGGHQRYHRCQHFCPQHFCPGVVNIVRAKRGLACICL